MQTAREAIDGLMRGRQAELLPMHDSIWGDALQRWVKEGMPANDKGEPVDAGVHFGFDMVHAGGWLQWEAKPEENKVIEETEDWKIVRNGSGAALKWWKHQSGTPEHIDFHMSNRAIWERDYKPHLAADTARKRLGDISGVAGNLKRIRGEGRWAQYGTQFLWEDLRASLGDVNMFMALADDPEWIHDFNRTYTDLYKAAFKILMAEGGVPDGVWIYEDLGYRDRLFCRPETLRDVIFPYYREIVEFLHGYGVPVVLHSCGYQEPMIPLAIEAGFEALNPMEVKAGNDIFKYAEKYGDKLCFVGGLDARILESGDRAVIRKGVTDFIQGMRQRGARFVYGSDHSLSTNISYQDFLYSVQVFREFRNA